MLFEHEALELKRIEREFEIAIFCGKLFVGFEKIVERFVRLNAQKDAHRRIAKVNRNQHFVFRVRARKGIDGFII